MHDVPATALNRADLATRTPLAKVGLNAVETSIEMLSNDDDALDSEGLSIESDSTMEVEPMRLHPEAKENFAKDRPETMTCLQPVTLERENELEKTNSSSPPLKPHLSDEKKYDELDNQPSHLSVVCVKDESSEAKQEHSNPSNACDIRRSRRSRSRRYDDDGSSSDDDSYFSKNLPSPKSGRSFSYSSSGSAGAVAASYYQNNAGRESDASLSFSDESDDEIPQHGVCISPMIQPKGMVADMNLYPQRITRMHSVSSLVSSASSDEDSGGQRIHRSSGSSVSSYATSGTTSDRSVKAELYELGGDGRPPSQFTEVSGRRSPVMGQKGIPGYLYSSPSPAMSPPAMIQGYALQPGMSHPQPQPISQEQMDAWIQSGGSAGYSVRSPVQEYGAAARSNFGTKEGGFRNVAEHPFTVPCSLRGDEEGTGAWRVNQYAGGIPADTQFPSNGNRYSAGIGSSGGSMSTGLDSAHEARSQQKSSGGVAIASDGEGKTLKKMTSSQEERSFKVFWRRWLMLFYMSVLNLLSDWTCYSVAPISLLTEQAFGNIDPERLVVVFLGANAVASICEPIILSRLGLRRTVLFGALLLMIGSIVKSGGVPPILQSDIEEGESEWRLYLGFFLVGLSQPLYQCTPTLLSSSWFPEEERTLATGVALNSNQLGIGFAFVFGTLLVSKKDDIIPYFGLLSTLSTIVFMGALVQFDDAPPTPPSASARVMRGTFEVNLPSINTIVQSVREGLTSDASTMEPQGLSATAGAPSPAAGGAVLGRIYRQAFGQRETSRAKESQRGTRRRATVSRSPAIKNNSVMIPSSALPGSTADAIAKMAMIKAEASEKGVTPPSPMMPGRSDSAENPGDQNSENEQSPLYREASPYQHEQTGLGGPSYQGEAPMYPPGFAGMPPGSHPGMVPGMMPPGMMPPGMMPPPYQYPYWDPRVQQQIQQQHAYYQQQFYNHQQPQYPPPTHPYYFPNPSLPPPHLQGYNYAYAGFPIASELDEGAEPIITITPHHLDIDIRDDQVIRSLKACFARSGFIHALVAFTASGIVINTLSTYMDYLVRLNGAPRAYTGIVGGTFQFIIMISSLIIGKFTDNSRAYYSVTIGMLVLGAFGLAECGVSLDSDRGNDLRWCLVIVAALVGPLQPVSTELGVDVVYPLSENTVLVIQQLFSNLLSALFIPVFKALKDVGSAKIDDTEMFERPQYTFSFYLLILIHTAATVFFATFNGKYLRYEHELERKAEEEEQDERERQEQEVLHPFFRHGEGGERQPLVSNPV